MNCLRSILLMIFLFPVTTWQCMVLFLAKKRILHLKKSIFGLIIVSQIFRVCEYFLKLNIFIACCKFSSLLPSDTLRALHLFYCYHGAVKLVPINRYLNFLSIDLWFLFFSFSQTFDSDSLSPSGLKKKDSSDKIFMYLNLLNDICICLSSPGNFWECWSFRRLCWRCYKDVGELSSTTRFRLEWTQTFSVLCKNKHYKKRSHLASTTSHYKALICLVVNRYIKLSCISHGPR